MIFRPLVAISIVLIPLAVSGCSAIRAAPSSEIPSQTDLADSLIYVPDQVAADYYAATTAAAKALVLDNFLRTRIAQIDYRYEDFKIQLRTGDALSSLGATAVVMGLSGAIASGVSPGLAETFGAISGGVTGFKEAFDKEAFYDKTIDVLIKQMRAQRDLVHARMLTRLAAQARSESDYPLVAVQKDLRDYWVAGTLIGALGATSDAAAATQEEADEKIDAAVFRVELTDRSRAIARWLKLGDFKKPYDADRVTELNTCMEKSEFKYPDDNKANFSPNPGQNNANIDGFIALNRYLGDASKDDEHKKLIECLEIT